MPVQPKAPGNAFPADPGALGYGEIGPNNFNIPTTLISLQISLGYGEIGPNNFNIHNQNWSHIPLDLKLNFYRAFPADSGA